jgi:ferrochelatase
VTTVPPRTDVRPFDGLLLLSFGGPEGPDDVLPFLTNVTRGRGIPRERLAEVAEHYHHFGGRSPINDQNRALLAALRRELGAAGIDVPVAWGNRNWDPFLVTALRELRDAGATRVAVVVTSAYSSYSGCRQYREDLAAAVAAVPEDGGGPAPQVDKLRAYFDHPGFVAANADAVAAAFEALPAPAAAARLVFVTHSVPVAMQETSGPGGGQYVAQHLATAGAVAAEVGRRTGQVPGWDLVYCSRSGPPHVPWTEPDVNDHLSALAAAGTAAVVLAPIGFVSDHMEVVFDLDTEARETADRLGLALVRAATAGTHPAFVAALRDLLVERAAAERGDAPARAASSPIGPLPDRCVAGCCPNLRGPVPALCGQD